jgi:endoglucanase
MIRNILLISFAILLGSCCGKNDKGQTCEQTHEQKCCSSSEFGRVDSFSMKIEILPEAAYPKGSPVDKWGKLKVAENENGVRALCGENGKPVQLRGVSSHGLQWAGVANLTRANVKALREKFGANLLRIALYVDEEAGYAYNPTLRYRTYPLDRGDGTIDYGYNEDIVTWYAEYGIYCLIDWHVHNPGNPQHWKYRNRKYPENVEGMDLAADFFTYCARRFQNQKHVLYEVCNEPSNNGKEANEKDLNWIEHVKPYCEDMLKIIRGYDKDVIVICGSPEWSKDLESIVGNEPKDANGKIYDNVMYAYHFYAASHGAEYKERFSKMAAKLPIFVTEWGTTKSDGRTDVSPDLAKLWLNILDGDNEGKQVISWINYSFGADGGNSRMFRWDSGNFESQFPEILSESGKFVYQELQKANKRNNSGK